MQSCCHISSKNGFEYSNGMEFLVGTNFDFHIYQYC